MTQWKHRKTKSQAKETMRHERKKKGPRHERTIREGGTTKNSSTCSEYTVPLWQSDNHLCPARPHRQHRVPPAHPLTQSRHAVFVERRTSCSSAQYRVPNKCPRIRGSGYLPRLLEKSGPRTHALRRRWMERRHPQGLHRRDASRLVLRV